MVARQVIGHTHNRVGVYGLQIRGLERASAWMQPAAASAQNLAIEVCAIPRSQVSKSTLESDLADVALLGGGRLRMRRGEDKARFSFPAPPPEADVLHPYLAPAAALAQLWAGNEALHAGSFLAPAGAVLLLAGKEGGKSTTLAWLASELNVPVLADDLVVIAAGDALAGPRCLDLRWGHGRDSGGDELGGRMVRAATRRRFGLGAAPGSAPVVGTVVLEWGPAVELASLPGPARMSELAKVRMYGARVPPDPTALLDLAAHPMLRLMRPRGAYGLRAAAEALLTRFA
jgi:hypothetical protein